MAAGMSWIALLSGDKHGHRVQVPDGWIEGDEAPEQIEVSTSQLKWRVAQVTVAAGSDEDMATVLVPCDWPMSKVMKHILEPAK